VAVSKKRLLSVLVAGICAGVSPVVFAEDVTSAAPPAVEPVQTLPDTVVTGSGDKEIPIQDRTDLGKITKETPISGAVVTADDVEHLQLVNNLLELGKRVPGISMIRNMRIPDGGKQYTENRIDGMRAVSLNTSVLDEINITNVDRIDIITGPASALYGSGALGGTISVTTRQPPRKFEGKLSQEAGSWDFSRTQIHAGASTGDGRYGFLVAGSTMDYDGWRRSNALANQDAAAEHKDGVTFKTLLQPTGTTKITLGLDQLKYDYRWAGTLRMTKWEDDWRQVEEGTYGQSIDTYTTVTGRVQQVIGDRGELTVAYGQIKDDATNYGGAGSGGSNNVICDDSSALAAPIPVGRTVKCRAVNNNSSTITNTLKQGTSTAATTTLMYRQDFDLAKSKLHVGVDMVDLESDSATYYNTYTALEAQAGSWAQGDMTPTGQGSVAKEDHSTPYVHYEFSATDRLRLHIGERFGKITYDTDDRTSSNKDYVKTYKGNVVRSGATYEITADHLVWANVGQTFNAPSSSTLFASGTLGSAGYTPAAELDPENGLTREIGFRGLFRGAGLQYDVTFYHALNEGYVTKRDCTTEEQAAINLGFACTLNENAASLTAQGMEAMVAWAATSWMDVGATYTDARVFFNEYRSTTFDYTGNSYQAAPKHRLNLRLAVKPVPGWKIELEGDHISDYYIDNANSDSYSRPDLYSLRSSYTMKDWSFWLHALNLTDEKYATRVSNTTIAGQTLLAASAGQGNAGTYTPRTLRAGIAYRF
jgi:iron complex outermembrane recepter protein